MLASFQKSCIRARRTKPSTGSTGRTSCARWWIYGARFATRTCRSGAVRPHRRHSTSPATSSGSGSARPSTCGRRANCSVLPAWRESRAWLKQASEARCFRRARRPVSLDSDRTCSLKRSRKFGRTQFCRRFRSWRRSTTTTCRRWFGSLRRNCGRSTIGQAPPAKADRSSLRPASPARTGRNGSRACAVSSMRHRRARS